MPRPPTKELTERELEIMHVFWQHGELTAAAVRNRLAEQGRDLAYTTVATLVRILVDKGYVRQTNSARPYTYCPLQPFQEVSRRIVSDLVDRVFHGSRAGLLLQLMEDDELSDAERKLLEKIAAENHHHD